MEDDRTGIERYMEAYDQTFVDTVRAGLKVRRKGSHDTVSHQPWFPLSSGDLARMRRIWEDYSVRGVIRDLNGLYDIVEDFVKKICMLDVNTLLGGHKQEDPIPLIEDALGITVTDAQLEKICDYTNAPDGTWRISDYGLDKLVNIAIKMLGTTDAEQLLLCADSVLNVVHQRSDLAAWFVVGGRRALTELSG